MARAKLAIIALSLITALLAGCSNADRARSATLARWERQLEAARQGDASEGARKIAESGGPKCYKDRISSAGIRRDVLKLEAARGGAPVQGQLFGKDLSSMTGPQGQFLLSKKDYIFADGADFSACEDAPCLVNQIYGKPGSDAGWIVYGWFLRMGSMISLMNSVPEQPQDKVDPVQADRKAFLFPEEELYALWRMSALLPPKFRQVQTVAGVHRYPPKKRSPAWGSAVCATATWGTRQLATARFSDNVRCLELSPGAANLGDDFYTTVAHEFAHTLDATIGTEEEPASISEEWLAIGGWTFEIEIDPTVKKEMAVHNDIWKHSAKKNTFVSTYSRESPIEDWAESVSHFRFRPAAVAKASPDREKYVSQKLYGGRTFTPEGLTRYYEQVITQQLSDSVVEIVDACLANPATGEGQVPQSLVLTGVTALQQACLDRLVQQRITRALDELRADEYEACDLLATGESALRARIIAQINPEVTKTLAQRSAIAPMLQATKQLRSALAAQLDPREAYLHCFRKPDPRGCYQAAISDGFDRVVSPVAVALGDRLAQEREAYLSKNSFDAASDRVAAFYQELFSGVGPVLADSAKARWKDCLDQKPDGTEPVSPGSDVTTQPFSGGAQFVAAPLLNCINAKVLPDLSDVRERYLKRLGLSLTDADVQLYLQEALLPSYLQILQKAVNEAANLESAERAERKAGVTDVLVGDLTSKKDWYKASSGFASLQAKCVTAASAVFDAYFAKLSPEKRLPTRFAAWEDVRRQWSTESCAKVFQSLSGSDPTGLWSTVMNDLEAQVLASSADEVSSCAKAYPKKSSAKQRKSCLINQWDKIESEALQSWMQTASGQAFASPGKSAQAHLSNRRSALQAVAALKLEP